MAKLYKRKDSPYWWASGRDADGRRWQKSTGQESKSQARKIARAIELDRLDQALSAQPIALCEAFELSNRDYKLKGSSAGTVREANYNQQKLISFFGEAFDVTQVTLADCERYTSHQLAKGNSRNYVSKQLNQLYRALGILKRHNLYSSEIRALRPDALKGAYQPRTRWLTLKELEQVLSCAEFTDPVPPSAIHSWHDYIMLYAYTGMRRGEVEFAKIEGGAILVESRKTMRKGVAYRSVPIAAPIAKLLAEKPLPWPRPRYLHELHSVAAAAGVAPFTVTDLRRTFCSYLANAGVAEMTVTRLMGHTDSTMIRRVYAQLSNSTLEDAVGLLPTVTNA